MRLPVDRVFTMKGFGTVVTGTLVSGEITAGQDLVVLPEGRVVRVRGVQVHGRDVTSVAAPSRTAINLGSVEVRDLARGVTLSSPDALAVTRRVDARLELLGDARPLRHGARVRVHHGTAERLGRVAVCAVAEADRDWSLAAVGESSVAVNAGGRAYARIRLERPMALTRGDRLILRTYSPPSTIGGAVVLDPAPPASGLRRPAMLERFKAIDVADTPAGAGQFLRVWLREAGERGFTAQDVVARGGLGPEGSRAALSSLVDSGLAVIVAARVFDNAAARAIEAHVLSVLEAFHRAQPREAGLPKEELRERVAPRAAPALVDYVIQTMTSRGVITGTDRVALATHRVTSLPGEERDAARVEALLHDAGLTPPDAAAIATAAGLAAPVVEQALKTLARAKRILKLDTLWFHVDVLARLKQDVQQRAASGATSRVDVATFKERYGLSRKYAIPLLEWLDRERVTRRVGDGRVVL